MAHSGGKNENGPPSYCPLVNAGDRGVTAFEAIHRTGEIPLPLRAVPFPAHVRYDGKCRSESLGVSTLRRCGISTALQASFPCPNPTMGKHIKKSPAFARLLSVNAWGARLFWATGEPFCSVFKSLKGLFPSKGLRSYDRIYINSCFIVFFF